MKISETICDREWCKTRNASGFSIFSHRASDAAGGMENWHFVFDLCPSCAKDILVKLFSTLTPESGKEFLETNKIKSVLG